MENVAAVKTALDWGRCLYVTLDTDELWIPKTMIRWIITENLNMRVLWVISSLPKCGSSTMTMSKIHITDCEGVFGTERHLYLYLPTQQPLLGTVHFFFFFLFLRIKTQLDGHHLALLLIRSHQLWWRHWTILHMKISSTAAKNDSIVRIIVFSSRRLTLMVI